MDKIIGNRYKLVSLIGKGGMSKVYLAIDEHLNKTWAVKEITKDLFEKNNDNILYYTLTEIDILKRLDHPCLPRIVDVIENDAYIYIIMDYIEGTPLSAVIENDGPQPQDQVIIWAKEICGALEYLHTRQPPIIYRDMKPANIILTPGNNVKIIDFGTAREYKNNRNSDTVMLGTLGYAAPEQYSGNDQTDPRTDIYSLGVTLYYLVTGHSPNLPPYELYPIRMWNTQLSEGLENIIKKCTQINPGNRYQSCRELYIDLCLLEVKTFGRGRTGIRRNICMSIKKFLNENIIMKNKKCINEHNPPAINNNTDLDAARYMGKALANIQNDEKKRTTLKGPDYNE